MFTDLSYQRLLETSQRVAWRLEDVIGGDKRLDFSRPFLPESFAQTSALAFLSPNEQLALNHIRAHGYLAMFELIERCILPFIQDHGPGPAGADEWRSPALQQFALEEAKHIELFVRFRREFEDGFGTPCAVIGPAEDIGASIRSHGPLPLAIFVLAIEWATQRHYLESVRADRTLDDQFKSLLRHHWVEESQHAKLDALVFQEMAARATPQQIETAIDAFLAIGAFVDGGLKMQAELDCAALEAAIGRTLPPGDRETMLGQQLQALRWTFLGSAMVNPGFLAAVGEVTPTGRARIEQVAPAFC